MQESNYPQFFSAGIHLLEEDTTTDPPEWELPYRWDVRFIRPGSSCASPLSAAFGSMYAHPVTVACAFLAHYADEVDVGCVLDVMKVRTDYEMVIASYAYLVGVNGEPVRTTDFMSVNGTLMLPSRVGYIRKNFYSKIIPTNFPVWMNHALPGKQCYERKSWLEVRFGSCSSRFDMVMHYINKCRNLYKVLPGARIYLRLGSNRSAAEIVIFNLEWRTTYD